MIIERKILNMYEFSRISEIAISVDNHFDEYTPSQGKSVPTNRQTVLVHRYVLIESHRKTSVTLWVHPLKGYTHRVMIILCDGAIDSHRKE